MKTVKIGVIGAGALGTLHIEKCLGRSDVVIVGFYDIAPQRCSVVGSRWGVHVCKSAQELIDSCDAVIVATPASTHYAVASSCLERGHHVLVEKPLAPSVEQGRRLVSMAHRQGVVLQVGHSEVFNPAFRALMLDRPFQPRFMEIHRLAEFSPRGIDVSVVLDLMVHDLHLIRRLCPHAPPILSSIEAVGVPVISSDVDIVNVRMMLSGGCVVNMTASRISRQRMRKLRIFAAGTYLSVDLDNKELVRCYLQQPSTDRSPIAISREIVPPVDALELEHNAFIASVRQPSTPTEGTTGEEALEVLTIAEEILKKIGRPVD